MEAEIRKWLSTHPLTAENELDVHGVPESLFELTGIDDRLKQLNRQIKGLPIQQQKLLLYLSRDIEPALIIESMEYASPDLFWLDKALLVKEVDPSARQHDVLKVFAANEALLEEIYQVSDRMDREAEKSKNRRYLIWSLASAPVVLSVLILLVYPLLVKPDPVALYEEFKSAYVQNISSIDTTSYTGGSYVEAIAQLKDGNYSVAAKLFEELVGSDSTFRSASRWYLVLINLRDGDRKTCKEQLKILEADDPAFYRKVAEKLAGKL